LVKVQHNPQGRAVPFLFCDACGKRIEDGRDAVAMYKTVDKTVAGATETEVFFVHKETCMDAMKESLGDAYDGCDELARHFASVTTNAKLTPGDLGAE
jgi:hypothetical protein